ncbi:sensor histidine kinase [Arsenicitalea aurantiaca]|nr:histidine kinase dimerization/phosphoacceptor domain -containing protein [Arsenicitalea aurantiaca]
MTQAATEAAPAARARTRGRRKLAFIGALLLLVGAAVAVIVLARGIDGEGDAAGHAHVQRERAREVLLDLASAEAAQRAFLLHRDPAFLSSWSASAERVGASFDALVAGLPGQSEFRQPLVDLAAPVADTQQAMSETIRLAEAGRWAEAIARAGNQGLRAEADAIRAALFSFINAQDAAFAARGEAETRNRMLLLVGILGALAAAGLLAWVIFARSQRQLAELIGLRNRLRSENETLEDRVRRRTAEAEEARAHAERERSRVETLLQDTNHRIGNSLATVSSLLALQVGRSQSDDVRAALEAAQGRIHAIASAHRRLRLSDDMETTSAGEFLHAVVEDLHSTQSNSSRVRFVTEFVPLVISARDATTLGILVGELVTNALKHAFAGREGGTLWVCLRRDENGIELCVDDDGNGYTGDRPRSDTGLGAMIVKQLARQFGGEPRYAIREDGGTSVCVSLPELGIGP